MFSLMIVSNFVTKDLMIISVALVCLLTSIFDYWGVPEYQKWMNGGEFDGGLLSDDQRKLRSNYAKLLNLCNDNEILQKGKIEDLHAYNLRQDDGYRHNKIFTFLKELNGKTLLIACNFSGDETGPINVKLPEEHRSTNWDGGSDLIQRQIAENVSSTENGVNLNLSPMQAIIIEPAN